MKKTIYYISPFIIIPLLMFISDFLDNKDLIQMSFNISVVLLVVTSLIIGNITPTNKKFDYIMTVIMPFAFFCSMFVIGFLDKSDLETRFHFDRAFRAVFVGLKTKTYLVMAITTFLASFKPIRIVGVIKKIRSKK